MLANKGDHVLTTFNTRKRLVTFRLSVEEYEAMKNLCLSRGMRSISELTREAVLQQLATERPPRSFVSKDLATLMSGLEGIDEALDELSVQISSILGPARRRSKLASISS